jgi:hypothetical protein
MGKTLIKELPCDLLNLREESWPTVCTQRDTQVVHPTWTNEGLALQASLNTRAVKARAFVIWKLVKDLFANSLDEGV